MLTWISALLAAACVAASARRLAFVVTPTSLDPMVFAEAVRLATRRGEDAELVARVRERAATSWERELLDAAEAEDPGSRIPLVNEQLSELDWRLRRWERVPRVCASVATSGGFLVACLALNRALALAASSGTAALFSAVDALAVGIAGTSFCAAVHVRAKRLAREHLAGADALVSVLETRASTRLATAGAPPVEDGRSPTVDVAGIPRDTPTAFP